MDTASRRNFLKRSLVFAAAASMAGPLAELPLLADDDSRPKMRLGLCTFLWGQDWDLPTLLANCEKAGILGVELRVEHKHRVDPSLDSQQRKDVKNRFADSPITLVGLGTNECFDNPDPEKVKRSLEAAKDFVRLSADCGGTGVKVKPNDFHKDVPREKTVEQIGKTLNALGQFAADFGQQIRLEVHGSCCELPVIQQIMDVADHANVAICWNCNGQDVTGEGLEHNFSLIKNRLGATTHIHELNTGEYPYQQLINLLVRANYAGWALLECHKMPTDGVAAMVEQRTLFEGMLAATKKD